MAGIIIWKVILYYIR